MPTPPTLNGQVIGQAEKATRAVLDRLLDETGTSFHSWIVVNLVAGEAMTDEGDLVARLVHYLKIDEAAARRAIGDARSLGLVTVEATSVTITDEGSSRFATIRTAISGITARLYGDLPADDLQTTARVLGIVTERANAELAG
jgi:hypothetical protein